VRLPTVVPPPPPSLGAGVALAFSIRSNHQFNIEASLDSDSTSKRDNTNIIMDESVTLPVAEATDCGATALHRIRQNKQMLRKIIRSRIKSAYPNNNDNTESRQLLSTQSNQVFSRLLDLPQYKHANSVGFFLSMPSGEIQTNHAIRHIVNDGKVLYVPRVGLDFEMCDMELIRCDPWSTTAVDDEGGAMFYDDWPRNKWGIPEPPVTSTNVAKSGDIDLLIVPGLAFDTNGHRLGQGKLSQ
jgi:5-formyltetrahydrofolate cyclo-ligase